jgi:sugar/nucleoside kinase (ribokinase family)
MNTSLSASCEFNLGHLPAHELSHAKILYFTGYQLCTPNQKETVLKAVEVAKNNGVKVALDVSDPWVCQTFGDDIRKLIRDDVDLFFSNRDELKELYGTGKPEAILSEILEVSPKLTAAIKLGSQGCLIGTADRIVTVGAKKVNVVDTTGAGDMFAAGFIASWLKAKDLETCAESATTLAAEVIQHMGAKLRDEVLMDLRGRI